MYPPYRGLHRQDVMCWVMVRMKRQGWTPSPYVPSIIVTFYNVQGMLCPSAAGMTAKQGREVQGCNVCPS